ncbi:hypothetical protein Tco_0876585 [Tanacetum coccineum]|uniref:Uncharacterized protein n=1 Tax=Tanacetum coccineum TaxID=301880 RepID=A0ABQ5BXY0_9ASTR
MTMEILPELTSNKLCGRSSYVYALWWMEMARTLALVDVDRKMPKLALKDQFGCQDDQVEFFYGFDGTLVRRAPATTSSSLKTSPLEDDDLVEEEAIKVGEKKPLGNDIED